MTVNGRAVAEVGPARSTRATVLTRAQLIELVTEAQADAGLTADLQRLAGDTTDDLGAL